jgi:hypothetical protein
VRLVRFFTRGDDRRQYNDGVFAVPSRRQNVTRYILSLAVLAAVSLALPARADDKKPADTVKLFNGTDLAGWTAFLDPKAKGVKPADVWSVKDGVLRCQGKPFGYLLTAKEYGDYVLTVEWRWPEKAGNSGVFVHVSGPNKIWPKGVEAQLFSGHAGDCAPRRREGPGTGPDSERHAA